MDLKFDLLDENLKFNLIEFNRLVLSCNLSDYDFNFIFQEASGFNKFAILVFMLHNLSLNFKVTERGISINNYEA